MKLTYVILFLLFSVFHTATNAQENTDSIFQTAIDQVKNNHFSDAIENSKKALRLDPKRGDIMVYLANIYSWQNKNDTALIYIEQALKINYSHDDLYESWTNILLRTHQYEELLKSCNVAENNNYSNTEDLLWKRIIAYSELRMYNSGINLIEQPENNKFLESKRIKDLYSSILIKRNTNSVSAYYILDMFHGGNNAMPQHLGSLGYSFPVGYQNLGFRANYSNRFGLSGVQLESDFYLKLKNQQYMYFNYGYAFNSVLFPTHRFGIEYYFPLKYKTDASIGGRYMNYPTSNVLIATGHVGKYFGKNWISLHPFYVYAFKTPTNTESISLFGDYRLFGKNELDYWGLELGFGNSPDEIYTTSQTISFNQLTAYKIKLERNLMLNRISDLHLGFGYSKEEYTHNKFRDRFTLEIGYKYRLK